MGVGAESLLTIVHERESFDVLYSLGGFLAGYSGNTRDAYLQDLRTFVGWCQIQQVEVFTVRRTHIELFARWLERCGAARATIARRLSTVAGFYRYCVEEELLDLNPASNVRRPKLRPESTINGLDRNELGAFLAQAGLSCGRDHALACLLALNGLRVSEALNCDIDDIGLERSHHTLRVVRKGGQTVIAPPAPRTARTVYLAAGERTTGPIFETDGAYCQYRATKVKRQTVHRLRKQER